jgi:hypothetical protein
MVNSQVVQEIVNALKIDLLAEKVPSPIPVIEVGTKNVKNAIAKSNSATNATTATIYTTPTTSDFYITGAYLSVIKDVTSTSVGTAITFVRDANTETLLSIPSITLTVQSECMSCDLKNAIKCDRGTIIAVTNTTNVANIKATGTIIGILDEIN